MTPVYNNNNYSESVYKVFSAGKWRPMAPVMSTNNYRNMIPFRIRRNALVIVLLLICYLSESVLLPSAVLDCIRTNHALVDL